MAAKKEKNSTVKIPPPPKTKKVTIRNEVKKNLAKPLAERTTFNFNCSESQHMNYKIWCIENKIDMTKMFYSMWEHCKNDKNFSV
jgi:hypothetical protein